MFFPSCLLFIIDFELLLSACVSRLFDVSVSLFTEGQANLFLERRRRRGAVEPRTRQSVGR